MQSDDGNDDLSEINENLALEDFQYIQVNITNLGEHSDVFSSNHWDDDSEKNPFNN